MYIVNIVMWVMCVYEQCMSMCTCTRIDAPSPWWQGAAPTWTLEILKLQWHPQIRWIFMISLTKLEEIGKGIPIPDWYRYTPMQPQHSWSFWFFCRSFLLRFLLPFKDGQRRKVTSSLARLVMPQFSCDFYSIFPWFSHQESLIPLSFWPMIRKI